MPSPKNKIPVEADSYYHIYNRGNNYEITFKDDKDFNIFLWLFNKYLGSITEVYAYALLKNHFHFLIKTKPDLNEGGFWKHYRLLIIDYTKYFNLKELRSGSLFLNPYKRIKITNEDYLKYLIFYIHYNPQKHEIIKDFRKYKYSSFKAFEINKISKICTEDVFEIFGSVDNFLEHHQYFREIKGASKIEIED